MNDDIFTDNIVNDSILVLLVTLISILTTIGGVGGGGLLIPVYMLIGKFKIETAIPLTIFTILGDTAMRIIFLFNKKHPFNQKRDLIYFAPLLLITLADANTSFIGVILSNVSSPMITSMCLLSTLIFTFYKSTKKAINTYINEEKYLNESNHGFNLVIIDGIGEYIRDEDIESVTNEERIGDDFKDKMKNTGLMLLNVSTVSIFSITRSYFDICHGYYWIHSIGQFGIVSTLLYYNIKYILNDYEYKKENDYIFLKGDISWNNETIIKYISIGSITGFVSSYIGIGGGMLTTPIMIQTGIIPEVVIATTSVSTLFSCLISSINYIVEDRIPIKYGCVFASCSAIGSVGGIYISNYIVTKYKKQSPLIFFVALIIFTSIILLTSNAVTSGLFEDYKFRNICNV